MLTLTTAELGMNNMTQQIYSQTSHIHTTQRAVLVRMVSLAAIRSYAWLLGYSREQHWRPCQSIVLARLASPSVSPDLRTVIMNSTLLTPYLTKVGRVKFPFSFVSSIAIAGKELKRTNDIGRIRCCYCALSSLCHVMS